MGPQKMGVTPPPIFIFGTLRDLDHLEIVLGRRHEGRPAVLENMRVSLSKDVELPLLAEAPGRQADGLLLDGLTNAELERLDFYERIFDYVLQPLEVMCDGAAVAAQAYRPAPGRFEPSERDWLLKVWQSKSGALMRTSAVEVMRMMGQFAPSEVARRMNVIETRAQARLNARAKPSSSRFKHGFTKSDVQIVEQKIPHSEFFAVESVTLKHRTFQGGQSAEMNREVFVTADAVTVLPYDPIHDLVLLIEQFRAPMLMRGDLRPWALEAIAGRLDPGETPETTARREAQEEAGLVLGELHVVGRYYPAPGSNTEFLTSFLAECDLSQVENGVAGLDSEHEDIRRQVLSYAEFDDALRQGDIDMGPLLISGLWLQRERARLRG